DSAQPARARAAKVGQRFLVRRRARAGIAAPIRGAGTFVYPSIPGADASGYRLPTLRVSGHGPEFLGSRLLTVAHGCSRLVIFAAPLAVSLSDCRSMGGRGTHNLCERARFCVTSVTALLAQELRVTLDFVRRSNCRRFSLCGCHLRVVTLRFPDDWTW